MIEQWAPAGVGCPYHVHHAEDESFFVLDGGITTILTGLYRLPHIRQVMVE